MTTPTPPGGSIPASGYINNMLGGSAGTLAGSNPLQQSIDQLNNTINRLINTNFGAGSLGGPTRQQFGSSGSPAGAMQQAFPRMNNPYQPNQQQPGIGGGGPGGAGNVSAPQPFGRSGTAMMASAITAFGNTNAMNLLALNQYATTSMMGLNNNVGQRPYIQAMYRQAGATPGYLNAMAINPADAYASMYAMQQLGGTALINRSALGRAGLSGMAGFGISNPTLSASTASQLSAALYSPQFSMNMMMMGYNPIRGMNGSAMNSGQAAQSILQGLGLSGMNPARVYGNLASPKGQLALQYLFGQSGIPNQQAQQYLQTYSQLFSKGYSPTAASNLIQQATMGSTSSMKAAQSKLAAAGVSTATNDIQNLKNAQSVLTGRQGEYAGGFNDAISQSTSLLEDFNNALNKLLNGPLGTATGYGGGMGFMASGTRGAAASLGTIGGLLSLGRLLGGGGIGGVLGKAGGALGGIGGAIGGALGGIGGALGYVAAPAAAGAAAWYGLGHAGGWLNNLGIHNLFGLGSGTQAGTENTIKQLLKSSRLSTGERSALEALLQRAYSGQSVTSGMVRQASMGGGAAGVSSSQQVHGGNTQLGSISGSAKKAVGAAETQVGVPYVYGDEIPGVGFDCSGLIQWAYKQAGVSLPRTSQAMWASLKNKRIPLSQAQEGDLLFSAGADGSTSSPGHVAMMVNGKQLIQAPFTGASVSVSGYDPAMWSGAARPSGRGSFVSGGIGNSSIPSATSNPISTTGNRGLGGPGANSYGSAEEVDIISAMGSGLGSGSGFAITGSSGTTNGSGSPKARNTNVGGGSLATPSSKAGIIALAKRLAQQYGWSTGNQWDDFVRLENQEAGWNVFATNPSSGAYGIPQALPPDKMSSAGPDWRTSAATQLRWMFGYIKGRYGSPTGAWAHEVANNWYGAGGMLQPGLNIVGDRGPELALNVGGKTQIISNSQTQSLISALKGNVPQNPWKTDITQGSGRASTAMRSMNINFNAGSIVIHMPQGSSNNIASQAGREVSRQIVRHINDEAISHAIRNGEKL